MAKGYWIARVDVRDPVLYKNYVDAAGPAFQEFGARFIVRGGGYVAAEGQARGRNVVIEFPSMEAAKACFESPQYQAARAHRLPVSDADIVIVEGVDG
jgi:uncharacterized protein (DUF1330 family)